MEFNGDVQDVEFWEVNAEQDLITLYPWFKAGEAKVYHSLHPN